jgi:hypothetical protein
MRGDLIRYIGEILEKAKRDIEILGFYIGPNPSQN